MPSSFKVIARNHSHIIRSSRSEVVATKSTTANDLKVTRVGACVVQIQERMSPWIRSLYVVVSVSYY